MNRIYALTSIVSTICVCVTAPVSAQTGIPIHGVVVLTDTGISKTAVKVGNTIINNLATHEATSPDNLGVFSINAKIGDSIEILCNGFPRKIMPVTSYEHMTVYLDRTVLLDEVVISANIDKKADMGQLITNYNRQKKIYFDGQPPIALLSPFDGSPITFFRELLSRDAKQVRRFKAHLNQLLESDQIEMRFNKQTIKKVITINDNEITDFITAYRPDLTELESWSDYELYKYIKKSYTAFKKSPP
ncbi:hypothetical protein H8S90_00945 [Olivibacter sp. SDN3]|uniref:hypothetical protein n=1 Tax=Olivibacter sp. SDN3 TaxID=2764720 RepID=UPI001651ABE3|nr:hypothetical protein [Olivibacter sp. SDN3]QNL50232.1 hypothetical protein H8S90_00945 [Olivibacter sp. SDN3]